jgi:hypothetical protein
MEFRKHGIGARMGSLLKDLTIVYFHIVLPSDLSLFLPPVTNAWGGFSQSAGSGEGKAHEQFEEFLNLIEPTEKPALYFLHSHLPHSPWHYLPSGKEYSSAAHDGLFVRHESWPTEEAPVKGAYQRHLLQVAFIDRNFGRLVKKLKETGMYDRSLIVVTADHGVSFRPSDYRRVISGTNYADIICVPLFIKRPGVNQGRILDWNVESIDIFPTVLEILGINVPWELDGVSVLNSPPVRRKKTVWNFHRVKKMDFEAEISRKYDAVIRRTNLFGEDLPLTLPPEDNFRSWLNRDVGNLRTETDGKAIKIDWSDDFENVNPSSGFMPLYITGNVYITDKNQSKLILGIAVNGTIRAITESFHTTSGRQSFGALIPEHSFKRGKNSIQVLHFRDSENPMLLPYKTE